MSVLRYLGSQLQSYPKLMCRKQGCRDEADVNTPVNINQQTGIKNVRKYHDINGQRELYLKGRLGSPIVMVNDRVLMAYTWHKNFPVICVPAVLSPTQ